MVEKHLPDGADIHGGGNDLRFPHHENELAQSTASLGERPDHTFVRAWAHHGMVTLADDKMAKSVGNVLDVKNAVERHGRNALRMWLLQSHYSQPIDYSEEILEEKNRAYWRLQNLYAKIIDSTSSSDISKSLATRLRERFDAAMQDDFNTPEAVAALFEATRQAGQQISERLKARFEFVDLKETFDELMGQVLGFDLGRDQTIFLPPINITLGGANEIQKKLFRREQARQEKDYALADLLRDEIQAEGWAVEDTPEGPVLRPS